MADDDVPWLDPEERAMWLTLIALSSTLTAAVETDLQREAGLSLFDYTVLAMLSEHEDRTMRMSELAAIVNGSLSRLSHVARRLESRGYLTRAPLAGDGRVTVAAVTDPGIAAIQAAAPAHVRHVRRLVLDPLTRDEQALLASIGAKIIESVSPPAAARVREACQVHDGPARRAAAIREQGVPGARTRFEV